MVTERDADGGGVDIDGRRLEAGGRMGNVRIDEFAADAGGPSLADRPFPGHRNDRSQREVRRRSRAAVDDFYQGRRQPETQVIA
jgi:hypothetical protein